MINDFHFNMFFDELGLEIKPNMYNVKEREVYFTVCPDDIRDVISDLSQEINNMIYD